MAFNISSRRYLGNKYKLLDFITEVVNNNCQNVNTVCDIFSGTGSVASAFLDKQLIVNDMMYSNYMAALAWFSPQAVNMEQLMNIVNTANTMDYANITNYMSENFANTYFSELTCKKIGHFREMIEQLYNNQILNERERAILITSLIYTMDKHAKTCGHYDSFIQNAAHDIDFTLDLPNIDYALNPANQCYNQDANVLIRNIACDLLYLDPPYNSRQYCDAYHLLENVALWNQPEVFGVAKKMDRTTMKSNYCKTNANVSLEDLVTHANCRYILLSYNNSGNKFQIRSNAKIKDDEIIRILGLRGPVTIFDRNFKAFNAGKSENPDNRERLFLCQVQN